MDLHACVLTCCRCNVVFVDRPFILDASRRISGRLALPRGGFPRLPRSHVSHGSGFGRGLPSPAISFTSYLVLLWHLAFRWFSCHSLRHLSASPESLRIRRPLAGGN